MEQQETKDVLVAKPATFTAVIEIKRAATGKVEVYDIVGTELPESPKAIE